MVHWCFLTGCVRQLRLRFRCLLAVATGAILYIIGELYNVARRLGAKRAAMWGLLFGFMLAYATELVLAMSGA